MALLDSIKELLGRRQVDPVSLAQDTASQTLAQQAADTAISTAQPISLANEAAALAQQSVSPILSQQAVDVSQQATQPIFQDVQAQQVFQQNAATDAANYATYPIFQDIASQAATNAASNIASQNAVDTLVLPSNIPDTGVDKKGFLYQDSTGGDRGSMSNIINSGIKAIKELGYIGMNAGLALTNASEYLPYIDGPEKSFAQNKNNRDHIPVTEFKAISDIVDASGDKQKNLDDLLSKYGLQGMSLDTFKNDFSPKYINYYAGGSKEFIDWKAKGEFYGQSAAEAKDIVDKSNIRIRDARSELESNLGNISSSLKITSDEKGRLIAKQGDALAEGLSTTFDYYKNYQLTKKLSDEKGGTLNNGLFESKVGNIIQLMMDNLPKKETNLFLWYNEADAKGIDRSKYIDGKLRSEGFKTINGYLIGDENTGEIFNPDSLLKLGTHINQIGTYEGDAKHIHESRNFITGLGSVVIGQGIKTALLPALGKINLDGTASTGVFGQIASSDLKLGAAGTISDPNGYIEEALIRTRMNVGDILPTVGAIYLTNALGLLGATEGGVALSTEIGGLNTIARAIQGVGKIISANAIFSLATDGVNPSNTNREQIFNMLFDFDLIPLFKNSLAALKGIDRNTGLGFKEVGTIVAKRNAMLSIKEIAEKEGLNIEDVMKDPSIIKDRAIDDAIKNYNDAKSGFIYKMPTAKESDAIKQSLNAFEFSIAKLAEKNPETASIIGKSIFGQSFARSVYTDILSGAIEAGKSITPENLAKLDTLQNTLDLYIKDNSINVADMIKMVYGIKDDVFFGGFFSGVSKDIPSPTKYTGYIIPEGTNLLGKTPEDKFTIQEASAILGDANVQRYTTSEGDGLLLNKDGLEYLNIRKTEDYVKLTQENDNIDSIIEKLDVPNKEKVKENANMLADIFSKIVC